MNLTWSHSQARPLVFAEGISLGMGKHCDLGHIVKPATPHDDPRFKLDVEAAPTSQTHVLGPGQYRIALLLAAANSRPVSRTVCLRLTGKWYDDESEMLSQGLGVSVG